MPKATTQPKKPSVSRSYRAGVSFPVGRLATNLKRGNYAKRVGESAPIFMAAVLDYLVGEILSLAGDATLANKKVRITPEAIFEGVNSDSELQLLFVNAQILNGGYQRGSEINPFILEQHNKNKN